MCLHAYTIIRGKMASSFGLGTFLKDQITQRYSSPFHLRPHKNHQFCGLKWQAVLQLRVISIDLMEEYAQDLWSQMIGGLTIKGSWRKVSTVLHFLCLAFFVSWSRTRDMHSLNQSECITHAIQDPNAKQQFDIEGKMHHLWANLTSY